MFKYNIYLGYQKSYAGFPFLKTIEYSYPLQKGDVIIVANDIFEAIGRVAKDVSKETLKYNQQYRIASIHHTVDYKSSQIPDIYLVTEQDYYNKFNDIIPVMSQIERVLKESTMKQETQLDILKGLDNLKQVKSEKEAVSTYRNFMDFLNGINEDYETVSRIIHFVKEASKHLIG